MPTDKNEGPSPIHSDDELQAEQEAHDPVLDAIANSNRKDFRSFVDSVLGDSKSPVVEPAKPVKLDPDSIRPRKG